MDPLLTREEFRSQVLAEARGTCVICQSRPAVDAHHVLERKLWPDGGYYLSNGAAVCEPCHLDCEATTITVDEVRQAAGIDSPRIPPQLDSDLTYDKWGNIVMPNGQRLRGELFYDE